MVLGIFSTLAAYENRVAVQAIRTLDDTPVDTLYIDSKHQIQVLLENDGTMRHINLPFQIYADDNLTWTWDAQPDGFPLDEHQAITMIPHSRLEHAYEYSGQPGQPQVFFFELDMDGQGADTLVILGMGYNFWLNSGRLMPMLAFHLTPRGDQINETYTLCIDSCTSLASLLFEDLYYRPVHPEFDRPICWPVKRFVVGDFDMDGEITVGDPVEIVQFIFLGKPNKGPIEAGDVNCDGLTDVADAVYLINFIFRFGPALGCL